VVHKSRNAVLDQELTSISITKCASPRNISLRKCLVFYWLENRSRSICPVHIIESFLKRSRNKTA